MLLHGGIRELLAFDRMVEEADFHEDGRHGGAEEHVVRVLANAAIAFLAAAVTQRALHSGSEVRGLPLRGAALDIVEDERDLGIDARARSGRIAAERTAIDIDAARGQHEGLVAALRARGRCVGVDRYEQVGRTAVRDRHALS